MGTRPVRAISPKWSLALIGNASGQKAFREFGTSLRGIFDKETRRKPLVFAQMKVKKAKENENVRLRHDSRSLAREASAAPAAVVLGRLSGSNPAPTSR